ncbi:MAG: PQQ-binding-like beta-propeller repeat protein [Candidatus Melainabacteria bacterium]|nr:PQQ-binding-like beta-propeller repeat protein [Candidatus Melainabacteria bacterium]
MRLTKINLVASSLLIVFVVAFLSSCARQDRQAWVYKPLRRANWSAKGMAETPVVAGDTVLYISGYPWNNQVYLHAVNKKDGKEIWTSRDDVSDFAVDGNTVYTTSRMNVFKIEPGRTGRGFLRAYSLSDGKKIWEMKSMSDPAGVSIIGVGKYVYCQGTGSICGVDKEKGLISWVSSEEIRPSTIPNVVIEGDTIMTECVDRAIAFVDGATGKTKNRLVLNWCKPSAARALFVNKGVLFIASSDGKSTVAFTEQNKLVGPIETNWLTSGVYLSDRVAYFGSEEEPPVSKAALEAPIKVDKSAQPDTKSQSYFNALDLESGKYLWRQKLDHRVMSSPASSDGFVVCATKNGDSSVLHVFDVASGKIISSTTCSAPVSKPVISNGVTFVNTGTTVSSIDVASGKINWSFKPEENAPAGSPVLDQSMIYVTAEDGNLYAFRNDKVEKSN